MFEMHTTAETGLRSACTSLTACTMCVPGGGGGGGRFGGAGAGGGAAVGLLTAGRFAGASNLLIVIFIISKSCYMHTCPDVMCCKPGSAQSHMHHTQFDMACSEAWALDIFQMSNVYLQPDM